MPRGKKFSQRERNNVMYTEKKIYLKFERERKRERARKGLRETEKIYLVIERKIKSKCV